MSWISLARISFFLIILEIVSNLNADEKQIQQIIEVQQTMRIARQAIDDHRLVEAIELLEKNLIKADGSRKYLDLLRTAYQARLQELKMQNAPSELLKPIERNLAILNPVSNANQENDSIASSTKNSSPKNENIIKKPLPNLRSTTETNIGTISKETPERANVTTIPPPDPAPLSSNLILDKNRLIKNKQNNDLILPSSPLKLESSDLINPEPKTTKQSVSSVNTSKSNQSINDNSDPFNQIPLDRMDQTNWVSRAVEAFEKKKYNEAERFFTQADRGSNILSSELQEAWGFCKLHQSALILNQSDVKLDRWKVEQQIQTGMRLCGTKGQNWGNQLLIKLSSQSDKTTSISNNVKPSQNNKWQSLSSKNFKLFFSNDESLAQETLELAETIRRKTLSEWDSSPINDWKIRCEIYLFNDPQEFYQITKQLRETKSYSSIQMKGNQVLSRRIDLLADSTIYKESALPHEIAFLMLVDLFQNSWVPLFAEIGITVLAESPIEQDRYHRTMLRQLKDRQLLSPQVIFNSSKFPQGDQGGFFCVQSFSMVDYLVHLKGKKHFLLFLREVPRRGIEDCLRRYYGFSNLDSLQKKWLDNIKKKNG